MLEHHLLFFFSALGVFNVFLLALYIISRKGLQQVLLGLFLMALGIRVGVSCIYFFYKDLSPLFIQLGLMANVLSGLLLFIIIGSSRQQMAKWDKTLFIGILLVLLIFSWLYPFSRHFYVWDNSIRYVFHTVLTAFILASFYRYFNKKQHYGLSDATKQLVLISYTLVCLSFALSLYTNYVLGPVLFSVIFYVALFLFIRKSKKYVATKKEKYVNKKISGQRALILKTHLENYLNESQAYKNPNLKIKDLANAINVSEHRLSQLLNDNLGVGFTTYINDFRIEEAKKLLVTEHKLTIEAIGYESGFNSKSSFFTLFRTKTRTTPNAYRKQKLVQD